MSVKRLIETAFPLLEASAASLHEKNMRHGHISTLHLWPARRPLAASRAAIAAALLPDPDSDVERAQLVRRLGGRLVPKKRTKPEEGGKVQVEKVTGEGGILWWGQESGPDLAWFREAILDANGGKPPRILDPFAGGGAIPLEALRLGCEVTANDLNPVAWFILKCTLEYPQRLAGERRPLPDFALKNAVFMEAFLKTQGMKTGPKLKQAVALAAGAADAPKGLLELDDHPWMKADLAWHVRAWGEWVLQEVRRELAHRYPTYAQWMALDSNADVQPQPLRLLVPDENGRTNADELNRGVQPTDLKNPVAPRWVVKPTVAYLWARTVQCTSCRAITPLLKTRWLCKKEAKRVRLTMEPNAARDGVIFDVESAVPIRGATSLARKAADKELGGGTMSRSGVQCPCCGAIMRMDDLQYEAKSGRFGIVMTAVVSDGPAGKEYRKPTPKELQEAEITPFEIENLFREIPFGIPNEPMSTKRPSPNTRGVTSPTRYGLDRWSKLFTSRQLFALGTFVKHVRRLGQVLTDAGYSRDWITAIWSYLAVANDRIADRCSTIAHWDIGYEKIANTFSGSKMPMSWDFAESVAIGASTGSYSGAVEWIAKVIEHVSKGSRHASPVKVGLASALQVEGEFDAIVTDPPYYDAIPYSDLMDFFHVWLRRSTHGISPEVDSALSSPLGPKWSHDNGDGELIDDVSRFGGDREASKRNFENGMAEVLRKCHASLRPDGVLVLVFANKSPHAWETLVGAVIRAGFVVEGSLPIQTEMSNRTNALAAAALSSSVWLVCRKRPGAVRPGFSERVLEQMRENIRIQMHRFWDARIRGPDFVWAATGPALEAYSRYPIVFRESSASGEKERMPVDEFLREVRRIVVEFAVGRVLKTPEGDGNDGISVLDDVTTYYILHRDSFGMEDAPVGACILYALSCGVPDGDLIDRYELLVKVGGKSAETDDEDGEDDEEEATENLEQSTGSGSKVRLRRWDQRRRRNLGLEGYGGRPVPMIDRVHRVMQLWREGEQAKVNAFLERVGVARDPIFAHLVQALIELARRDGKGDEAVLLESISKHIELRSGISAPAQPSLAF